MQIITDLNGSESKRLNREHFFLTFPFSVVQLKSSGYLVCWAFCRSFVFQVVQECKETAAKRRRQSTRLENLGIPEEELLRQQQELFAKAREAAVMQEQQQQLLLLQQLTAGAAAGGAERPTGSTIGFYGSAEH
jgi:hypothetical protein